MLLLTSVNDLITIVTSAAGSIHVHSSWVDNASGVITPGRTNPAAITTATTTTIVGSPAASTQRNVKNMNIHNESTTVTNMIQVIHSDGTNANDIMHVTLLPNETLQFDEMGMWAHYSADATVKAMAVSTLYNASTAAQGPGFAADTYLIGSFILFPTTPKVGTKYKLRFDVAKTAAGTATPIVQVRVGTAGSTADTSRNSFTFSAGTAAVDNGCFEVVVVFRAVGSGTSAVLQGRCSLTSQPTTGISSLIKNVQTTSGGFDSTVAGLGIGVSVNGGTSAAWTVQLVEAELANAA
jgi:hypothetical protein